MNEKISCLGTEKVDKMNSPARICQPVSASDNKNAPLDNERERNKTRKIKLAKEGKHIFDLYFRILNKDKAPLKITEKDLAKKRIRELSEISRSERSTLLS